MSIIEKSWDQRVLEHLEEYRRLVLESKKMSHDAESRFRQLIDPEFRAKVRSAAAESDAFGPVAYTYTRGADTAITRIA